MNLAEVEKSQFKRIPKAFLQRASRFTEHTRPCCAAAKAWLRMIDASNVLPHQPLTGPSWVRRKFRWGPSVWPLYFCEAIQSEELDCGALSCIARFCFERRGIIAYPVQLIESFSPEAIAHWKRRWPSDAQNWLGDESVYHEVVGVLIDDSQIRIWDPTDSVWLLPDQPQGYGAALSIKVESNGDAADELRWGAHHLACDQWCRLR